MLPKPLCEIACSLNENVERLAFSCVWKMNMDGTMSKKGDGAGDKDDIWYGRTVSGRSLKIQHEDVTED